MSDYPLRMVIGAPRRSGARKALLLVTEGNDLGPHIRPISICLEGSTPEDKAFGIGISTKYLLRVEKSFVQ
ncbi:MAG: hypothetical protein ACI4UA_00515 [Bacteroidaceae bacterium]